MAKRSACSGFTTNTSNIIFCGFGRDINGNSIAKFKFPNSKGFSIQTNMAMPGTHAIKRTGKKPRELTVAEILTIIGEAERHIINYGSRSQQARLRIYK